jgi:hypothetical protein
MKIELEDADGFEEFSLIDLIDEILANDGKDNLMRIDLSRNW